MAEKCHNGFRKPRSVAVYCKALATDENIHDIKQGHCAFQDRCGIRQRWECNPQAQCKYKSITCKKKGE